MNSANTISTVSVSVPLPSVEPQVKTHLTATDVSFSSYLAPNKPDKKTSSPQERVDDSELSIFDAQKYFNEGSQHDQVIGSSKRVSPIKEFSNQSLCDSLSFPRFSSASSVDGNGPGYRTRSLASSEASWNSQTGLLSRNARGLNSGAQTDGRGGSRFVPRWLLFRPKCPCSGRKSVRVNERPDSHRVSAAKEAVIPKMPVEIRAVKVNVIPDSQERFLNTMRGLRPAPENEFPSEIGGRHLVISVPPKPFIDSSISSTAGFTFPILPPPSISPSPSPPPPPMRMPWNGSKSSPASSSPLPNLPLPDNPLRDSLDVFTPPSDDFLDFRKSQENRTYDHQLKFPATLKSRASANEDDELGSDASSDLFEIESISTHATYPISHHRQIDSLEELRPQTPLSRNIHMDEKRSKDFGQETAKDYSANSPEFERSPKT